jgi:hypothetical protein
MLISSILLNSIDETKDKNIWKLLTLLVVRMNS